MRESILDGKRILAVDDEPDILTLLEEEIVDAYPRCQFEKAVTFETAVKMLNSGNYDLVILDIMGVRGFDLLVIAEGRKIPVAMLTAHALNPEALKRSIQMRAQAYLPKEKLGEMVPFLEDIFRESGHASGWGVLMKKLEGYFDACWGEHWQESEAEFWKGFNEKWVP
jgi:DNA-binding response OmpR family regulator